MALIVEDGTGTLQSESYVSVANADIYHVSFGNADWAAATETEKEVALRQATVYIDTYYKFNGEKRYYNQRLMWPRYGYADYEVFPEPNLVQACCELALRALSAPLFEDSEDQVILREVIGPLRTDYAYKTPAVRYLLVDQLLKRFVSSTGSSARIEFTG